MKRLLLAFAMATAALTQTSALISPEIHSDGSVTFRLRAERASEVTVRGEWMNTLESRGIRHTFHKTEGAHT
jgi:hypothetical protein